MGILTKEQRERVADVQASLRSERGNSIRLNRRLGKPSELNRLFADDFVRGVIRRREELERRAVNTTNLTTPEVLVLTGWPNDE